MLRSFVVHSFACNGRSTHSWCLGDFQNLAGHYSAFVHQGSCYRWEGREESLSPSILYFINHGHISSHPLPLHTLFGVSPVPNFLLQRKKSRLEVLIITLHIDTSCFPSPCSPAGLFPFQLHHLFLSAPELHTSVKLWNRPSSHHHIKDRLKFTQAPIWFLQCITHLWSNWFCL